MTKYSVGLGETLGEFRLFVAASGILFGFLLNVAFTRGKDTLTVELTFMVLALACAAISVLIFLLPAIYHHSHSFPITEEEAKKIYMEQGYDDLVSKCDSIINKCKPSIFEEIIKFIKNNWQWIMTAIIIPLSVFIYYKRQQIKNKKVDESKNAKK